MSKFPYCTSADFDNFIRKAGPGTSKMSGLFRTGHYADDLIRWEKAIPRSRTLVVFHEDFSHDAIAVMDQIQTFLGVPHFDYNTMAEREGNLTFLRGSVSKARGGKHYEPMSAWAARTLDAYFAKHTLKLMRYLDLREPPTKWTLP